jgi:hypothetical protein
MNRFLNMIQSEARNVYFTDWGQCLTYTPAHAPGYPDQPRTICGIWDISETGLLTDEGDRNRYHKMASLTLDHCDGPFQQGDTFEFGGLSWKLNQSPKTILDGLQTLEVISKQTYEIGEFRRKS